MRPIRWDVIKRNYEQMVKYATALRLGTAESEQVLRRFTWINMRCRASWIREARLGRTKAARHVLDTFAP
jgi:TnpA family transposase